jgi:ABC-2 type transport system ATP-binding protein
MDHIESLVALAARGANRLSYAETGRGGGSLVPLPARRSLATVADPAPAVLVDKLSKQFGDEFAVKDVSFSVPRGGTLGLLGGNGAGKTTTIAMIMGLVVPTSGTATVLGHDMARERYKALHRMNFESPYVAMPAKLTVRENLEIFGRLYGVKSLKARIAELVEEFDLGDVLHKATGDLSAGQKTRVSVAKALLNEPEVLLLDEPTASLDPDRAEWVRASLKSYQRRRNAALILSSHNMYEVEEMCDAVLIMSYGHVIERGAPAELIERYECDSLDEVFMVIAEEEAQWHEEQGDEAKAAAG